MKPEKQTMEKFQRRLKKRWPVTGQDPSNLFRDHAGSRTAVLNVFNGLNQPIPWLMTHSPGCVRSTEWASHSIRRLLAVANVTHHCMCSGHHHKWPALHTRCPLLQVSQFRGWEVGGGRWNRVVVRWGEGGSGLGRDIFGIRQSQKPFPALTSWVHADF